MIAIIGTWEMSPPLPCPPDESFNSGTSVKERHMLQLLTTDPKNILTDRKKQNSGNVPQYKQQGGAK